MTKQGAGSTLSLPASDLGKIAAGVVKGKTLGSHPFVVSDLDHRYSAIRRRFECTARTKIMLNHAILVKFYSN